MFNSVSTSTTSAIPDYAVYLNNSAFPYPIALRSVFDLHQQPGTAVDDRDRVW